MKVFMIAAISADGFIARRADELADWTSKEDKKLFVELTKRAGVTVMGNTTYKTIGRALPDRHMIVYSRSPISDENVEATSEEPKELVARLEREGFREVAICGGRSIYDLFLRAGVVDELYLTIEPVLFGEGIPLFNSSMDCRLRLTEHATLNENTILLHYEVIQ